MNRCLDKKLSEEAQTEISATSARIIRHIVETNPSDDVLQRDIEALLGIRRSTVSVLIKKMEKDGLLQRVSVESDARVKKILPTEKTLEMYHKLLPAVRWLNDEVDDFLMEGQLNQFIHLCHLIEEKLDTL